jgi:hypothetical protein
MAEDAGGDGGKDKKSDTAVAIIKIHERNKTLRWLGLAVCAVAAVWIISDAYVRVSQPRTGLRLWPQALQRFSPGCSRCIIL